MKHIFALMLMVLALVILLPLGAQAQRYDVVTVASQVVQPASTATNRTLTIDCRKQSTVTLQIEAMNDAASAATLGFHYQRSVDGSNWEPLNSLLIAFTGVTKSTVVTNLASLGAGYIKIPYTTNASASVNCTNLTIKYAIKVQAP